MSSSLRIDAANATTTNSGNMLIVGLNYLGSAGFSPGYTAEIAVLGGGHPGAPRVRRWVWRDRIVAHRSGDYHAAAAFARDIFFAARVTFEPVEPHGI